jgi:Domain of unknown function (DUF4347)
MNKPFFPLSRDEIATRALGLKRDPLAGELIALEQRMVFDGAGVAIVAVAAQQAADASHADANVHTTSDSTTHAAAELAQTIAEGAMPTPPAPPVEVVFIDSRVADIDAFKRSAGDQRLVVVVDAQEDGISKITQTLNGLHDVSAVHIVGHGTAGQFELGKDWIGVDAVRAHEAEIATWRTALTEHADILLYGCDVAKDTRGTDLINTLARESGADVAASADTVGKTAQGADWTLEKTTGTIETRVVAPADYQHALAPLPDIAPTGLRDDVSPTQCTIVFTSTVNNPNRVWTNDPRPTFYGSGATPGATVRLILVGSTNRELGSSAQVGLDGNFEVTPTQDLRLNTSATTSDGSYQLRLIQSLGTDNSPGSNSTFFVSVRTIPPAALSTDNQIVSSTNPTTPLSISSTPTIRSGLDTYTLSLTQAQISSLNNIGGALSIYWTSSDGQRSGFTSISISSGANNVSFRLSTLRDANGNFMTSDRNRADGLTGSDTYRFVLVDGVGNYLVNGVRATSDDLPAATQLSLTVNYAVSVPAEISAEYLNDDVSPRINQVQSLTRGTSDRTKNWTNDTVPTFRGSGIGGSTVNLYLVDGTTETLVATTTVRTSDNGFSITYGAGVASVPTLTEVTWAFRLKQSDGACESPGAVENSNFFLNIRLTPPPAIVFGSGTSADNNGLTRITTGSNTEVVKTDGTQLITTGSDSYTLQLTTAQVNALRNIGGNLRIYWLSDPNKQNLFANISIPSTIGNTGVSTSVTFRLSSLTDANNNLLTSDTDRTNGLSGSDTYGFVLTDSAGNFLNSTGIRSDADDPTIVDGVVVPQRSLTVTYDIIPAISVDSSSNVKSGTFTSANNVEVKLFYPGTVTPFSGVPASNVVANATVTLLDSAGNPTTTQFTPQRVVIGADGKASLNIDMTGRATGTYRITMAVTKYNSNVFNAANIISTSPNMTLDFSRDVSLPNFHLSDNFGSKRTAENSVLADNSLIDGLSIVGDTLKAQGGKVSFEVTWIDQATNQTITKTYSGATGATVGSNGKFVFTLPSTDLGNGLKTIKKVVATDQIGNVVTNNYNLTVYVASAWTPGGLGQSGLQAWYDPSISGGFARNSSNGFTLYDLSGNGFDALSLSGSGVPTLSGRYLNFSATFGQTSNPLTSSQLLGLALYLNPMSSPLFMYQ